MCVDFPALLAQLSQPRAFPRPVDRVEVHQTHISAVFVAGEWAYKIRKPVKLPFLDFSTLDLRHHDCDEEVRLNRRLAKSIYLGVVPIVQTPEGCRFEGEGPAVEWAVKMRRLPEVASLQSQVLAGTFPTEKLVDLGERLAVFHRTARRDAYISSFGRFAGVALNLRQNLELARNQVGQMVSTAVWERLVTRQEQVLQKLQPLIEARAARGIPCETHGDLHLDHVYFFPDEVSPDDVVMVDCIEFNERFRYTDPIADIAFLVMDLKFHGRRDLARTFAEAYLRASGDEEGRQLLPLYAGYRAAVRGKVEGMLQVEPEVPAHEREQARLRALGHWLLALGELLPAGERPGLLLVGGLPGTGKSTLARSLAQTLGAEVIRTDVVRKQLAGIAPELSGKDLPGLYSPEMTARTYGATLSQAEEALWQGRRVVVDATFSREEPRREFLNLADRLAVPVGLLLCEAPEGLIRERLAARRGDASDADWEVYRQARELWEPLSSFSSRRRHTIVTAASPEILVSQCRPILAEWELAESSTAADGE